MKETLFRLIRFGIVGGSATALDAVVYSLLLIKCPLNLAKLLSMLCSCTYSYILQKKWTFRDRGKGKKKIFLFIFSQIINITVNVKVNELAYSLLNQKVYAFIIATAVAMVVNYCLQHRVVFKG